MSAAPDRDDQVMNLTAVALSLAADERSGYLQAACGGDSQLLSEIHDTIEWEERMGGFLQKPWMSLQDLERPFKPGEVINHRFEVVREIGQGGMGVVYEAFDRKRGQRIAIKSAKLGFRRLLSPELESALKVRHPNICLVNEIHTATTDYGEIDFLTMELLDGPTLQARLASGPLPREEALEIARQICAGLAEAHRIGIIHKDLKPANIILSRTADGAPRAVITDFGLASEATAGSDVAGTPHYMAPELWHGEHASKASDLYALGVILSEMVTGDGKRIDAVISRCLDPSPAARPRDAAEVLTALTSKPIRKLPLVAAMILLIVVFAGLIWKSAPEPANVRLAILPVSGDAGTIVNDAMTVVAERLTHRKEPPTVVVVPPAQHLAATHTLQISSHREGNDLVVHGTIVDVATRTPLQEINGRYPISRTGDLTTALTGAVSKALRLRGETVEAISPAAATPYFQGLSLLRRDQHHFDTAMPLFQEAIRLDPHSPLPRAGMVEALVLKYSDTKEQRWLDEAERELQAAEALDPNSVAVLMAGGRLQTERGNQRKALDSYQRVAEREPRNVEVHVRIAKINDELGLRKEAIESYERAIALDPGYYETYEEFGVFYFSRGEYANAAEQFRKVIERAPRFNEAYTNLGATLNEMGQDDAAVQALRTSLSIKETGRALNSLAAIKAYQKRDDEALALYKRAFALDPKNYIFLLNLGDSSRRLGLARESRDYYTRGSELALQDLQNNPSKARTRAFVGYFAARLGDGSRARQEIEQALQFAPEDKSVIRRAVLIYEMLHQRDRALAIAETTTPDVLRELERHPDLAEFGSDPRFREMRARREKGG